ncbi:MAG TPA: DEAD/DEAH box helicase [Polyangia bacterium]|jgi:ATP-dependent Lhr-like helicase|nr:DEAD/DEAH box helicase [Polyangia bacterium]
MFHPVVSAWLARRFAAPTPAQARAWPLIAAGQDVLVTAPTGSGKTLAAFLSCLDRLLAEAISRDGVLDDKTSILYVSPLKALSNDIRRNLEEPLAELRDIAVELGFAAPPIRTAVRTGDTTARERREAVRRPPHVLVTTPESLYILLTSDSGRRALRDVRTVIVDEIHAVAASKRGAHLALSLERLEALVQPARLQRIGLSATVNPLRVAGQLLCGAGRPEPAVVDVGQRRDLDLGIEVPKDELGAVCTNEQWAEIYDRLADMARAHKSTLVFVNTRRLVERVAHKLGERLGENVVAAHHGSLSRERRFKAERRLKDGELKLVVATASLELGIDVGAVELCCLVGSPRSIATGLQRIGRSGHTIAATPKGRLFPLTRDQLVECAALVRAARRAEIDAIALRDAPLDILAQQIVAACSCEDWDEDALYNLCCRAAPYAALPRAQFDQVVDMLSEGIATSRGRSGAMLHRDAVARRLRGRRGARLGALTSGGAIPDNANYDVVLEPEGTLIGSLDEDFAIETMSGDVILLGNASWRVRRVEAGRVRVEDAAGAPPTIPFWLGEGPARTRELSAEVAALREEVCDGKTESLMASCALDQRGAELMRDYLAAGRAALGAIPTQKCVIAERFFDEGGGMQLVIHAPFGGRINRAWGMALRKRFCRSFDFELQAAATDDGLVLSLGAQHSFPLETIFQMLRSEDVDELLTQAALQAPMFETRWRWNAMRSLALLRHQGGRRVPPQIQRMRAQDLIAAVFPAQLGCQDNHGGGPIVLPDHPLVNETVRDCLTEAMDAAGLKVVLDDLRAGRIQTIARDLPEPSVFSHEILNANPYAFLDDAPLEERRTRAVAVRRGLPADVADRIGGLDPERIAEVVAEAQPDVRNADELHDLLLDLGALPEEPALASDWQRLFEELSLAQRATRLVAAEAGAFWIAAERRSLATTIWPERLLAPAITEPPVRRPPAWTDREGALTEVVRAHLALLGPTTAAILGARLDVAVSDVDAALARVEMEGAVLRGRFNPALPEAVLQWCDRRLLARINRRMLDGLRREIEPATTAEYLRFLLSWQHVRPGTQLAGRTGLAQVISQLQGCEIAAGAWEREILPARVSGYEPAWLDALCLSGEVAWGRMAPREAAAAPSRAAPIGVVWRRDLTWLLTPPPADDDTSGLSPVAQDVLRFLRTTGASFLDEIIAGAGRLRSEVEDGLWELVSSGRVTGDGFAGLRALISATQTRGGARARWHARWTRRNGGPVGAGRWALLRAAGTPPADDELHEALARQYIKRYGIVFRDVLAREARAPAWRDLLKVYRRLEMRGELRGGRLVGSFIGEQFAAPEALESLRALRRAPPRDEPQHNPEIIQLSACDPLNLAGILTPGPRIPATLANTITFRDGLPLPTEAALEPSWRSPPPSAAGDLRI